MIAPPLWYRLLTPILFIFWIIHSVIHALQFKQYNYILLRLGFFKKPEKNSLWIHASSVGEVNLIRPLCTQLLEHNKKLFITTFTATGYQRALELFNKEAIVSVIPMDCWPISAIFANRIETKLNIIAETELWPETLYQVAKKERGLIQINARLSDKSLKTSSTIKTLLINTLNYFDVHFTRYETDINNFTQMGVPSNKIKVIGNLKYAQISNPLETCSNFVNKPFILLASSHAHEELDVSKLLLNNPHFPLLVIAPRHPKRANEIITELNNIDLNISQRSKHQPINKNTHIYLADTFGELDTLFSHAEIVIMGGSFNNVGGHNLLEPASKAACIITGPSESNIKQDIEDLKKHNSVIQVDSIEQLENQVNHLLNHSDIAKKMGENAQKFVLEQHHVLNDYLKEVLTRS